MSTLTLMQRTADGWKCPRCGSVMEDPLRASAVAECNCVGMGAASEKPGFKAMIERLWEESKAREDDVDVFVLDESGNPRRRGQLFTISRETYLEWKAMGGNSKARRRWRRRNIPNSQRTARVEAG